MKKLAYLYVLMLFVFCASCGGQNKTDLPKDTVKSATKDTTSSQVPNSMVRNVKQARNGDILIASFKGVFRYDPKRAVGKSFTNLTNEISSPSFWDVLEDRKGNIWMATRDSGVYYYDSKLAAGQSFQRFTTNEGLASNTVMRIYEDRAGIIWFGTGGGISRYDPAWRSDSAPLRAGGKSFQNFTTEEGLSSNNINTIMEDKTGKLWIGTRGDLSIYDPARRSDSASLTAGGKTFTTPTNKDGKAFYNVWGITEDRKGNIWFGASIIEDKKGSTLVLSSGLWRYDPARRSDSTSPRAGGGTFTKVSERGAYAIIEDKKGNIWTTGEVKLNGNWALTRYDQKSLYDKKPTFTEIMSLKGSGALCGILEANDGSIWFGSLGPRSRVYRYDGKAIYAF